MRRILPTAAAIFGSGLLLVGCAGNEEPAEPVTETPDVTADKTAAPDPQLPNTWPLTGIEGEDIAQRPAVAVKIENTAAARPQTGLEDADIVVEEMVEGGVTRFNAVYHSQLPESVGPIRSLRPMDAGIAAPLGGVQVASGGQELFVRQLREAGVHIVSNDASDPGFERSPSRPSPHNLYGDTTTFAEQAEDDDSPQPQLRYALTGQDPSAVQDGETAAGLRLSFPSVSPGWTWQEGEEAWLRDEDGATSISADGTELQVANVVVLRVEVVDSEGRDQSGDPVPETVMTGEGEAVVASGGHTIEANWSKPEQEDLIELSDGEGTPIELAPGSTWIELVPIDRGGLEVQH